MFWYRGFPLIVIFGVLIGLRIKRKITLATLIPAFLMGILSGIVAWQAISQGEGAIYCDTAPCAASLMFFSVFGTWFIGIGLVVTITRFVAGRLRRS